MSYAKGIRPRPWTATRLASVLVLGLLATLPLQQEAVAQCTLTGGPTIYDDPANVPWDLTFSPLINTLALFKDTGGTRYVVDQHNFGYAVFSLANPMAPALKGWENIGILPGFTVTGDGQTTVGAVTATSDGAALVVGYCYKHSTLVLPQAAAQGPGFYRSPSSGTWEFGAATWDVMPRGGIVTDKLSDGRRIGYQVNQNGFAVSDISKGAGGGSGKLTVETVAGAQFGSSNTGPDLAVDTATGKRFLVYTSDLTKITVVDVTQIGLIAGALSSKFKVTTLAPTDFGFPSGTGVRRTRAAFHPRTGALELLVEGFETNGSSAGISIRTFDPTANGGLGGLLASDTRAIYDDASSPYLTRGASVTGGMVFVPYSTTGGTTPDDLMAVLWETKVSDGTRKIFMLSSSSWGKDLAPTVVLPVGAMAPSIAEGWAEGQSFYLLTGVSWGAGITKITCTPTASPAAAYLTVTNAAGAPIASGGTVYLGDTININPTVSPDPSTAGPSSALTDSNTSEEGTSWPTVLNPDATLSVRNPIAGTNLVGGTLVPPTTIPFTGPCDPFKASYATDTGLCWQSVLDSGDFAASPTEGDTKILKIAFEAQNGNTNTAGNSTGSAGPKVFSLNWKVPKISLQSSTVLLQGPVVAVTDGGTPTPTANRPYKWYFAQAADATTVKFDSTCTTASCAHTFPAKGSYPYWVTVPFGAGYSSQDCGPNSDGVCTISRGTITVNDVVAAFTAPRSVAKSASTFSVTNGTTKATGVAGCTNGGLSESGSYVYNICQETTSGVPCTAGSYGNTIGFGGSTTGAITTPLPAGGTYPATFWLRIRYLYTVTGSCGSTPLVAQWTPNFTTSDKEAWPSPSRT